MSKLPAPAVSSPSVSQTSSTPRQFSQSGSIRSQDFTNHSRQQNKGDGSEQAIQAERVKVVVRLRPPVNAGEISGALLPPAFNKLVLFRADAPIPQSEFIFDKVLDPSATQQDVFNAGVRDVIDDILQGYNGTVMAYGQTGAGKTYTLGNTEPDAIGMIPRAVAEVFKKAQEDPFHSYAVSMSYIQIYMELIQDLLSPESDNLQIREDANNGVYLTNAQEVAISDLAQCLHYLELGERNRAFAFTHLNAHSSRSHAVLMLTVVKSRKYLTNAEKAEIRKSEKEGIVTQKVKVGKLYLVDLAGSERLKKSGSTGLRASEAISINKSLTTLGMCISARASENPHVPFRESKLTRLLQESLGGNAKTTLVVCVADAVQHADETLQSLQFGSRAMCVKNKPVVNERMDYRVLHAELLSQFDTVHDRTHELEAVLLRTEEEKEMMQAEWEKEKAHFAALIGALRAETTDEVSQAHQQLADKTSRLSEVQRQAERNKMRIMELESEKAAMAEIHYNQVAELSGKVQELLTSQASSQASHRRESANAKQELMVIITTWVMVIITTWVVVIITTWVVVIITTWVVVIITTWVVGVITTWVVVIITTWVVVIITTWVVVIITTWVMGIITTWVVGIITTWVMGIITTWVMGIITTWVVVIITTWVVGIITTWVMGIITTWVMGIITTWVVGIITTWVMGIITTWVVGIITTWRHVHVRSDTSCPASSATLGSNNQGKHPVHLNPAYDVPLEDSTRRSTQTIDTASTTNSVTTPSAPKTASTTTSVTTPSPPKTASVLATALQSQAKKLISTVKEGLQVDVREYVLTQQQHASLLDQMKNEILRTKALSDDQSSKIEVLKALTDDQSSQVETLKGQLVMASKELARLKDSLQQGDDVLAVTRMELEKRSAELLGSKEELAVIQANLGRHLSEKEASLKLLEEELNDLKKVHVEEIERNDRVAGQRAGLLEERMAVRVRFQAALVIQKAYRQWRGRMKEKASERHARLAHAQMGQALVLASMDALRDAVEGVIVTFVGRKKELVARHKLAARIAQASPILKQATPSPHKPLAIATTGSSFSGGPMLSGKATLGHSASVRLLSSTKQLLQDPSQKQGLRNISERVVRSQSMAPQLLEDGRKC
ncbi:hypothetical protein CEUSTIGMA_g6655.t1 [Chlamydomonas eustigma]|uniref:Kinesin motor domain-containing protein n=1 Tax=Chlamydomonas eustigma TaxID=1157962 RepID=A0A250X823_9CHLO|nr:hypothetical protein CEUSTIGMA_g6655.t1 [Chlamydomonas eustigma]|eukprot:GAX79215.1 hypothetical protein CEUSTIGMA_g6655.t1 [Chlamydomonas eustigma]